MRRPGRWLLAVLCIVVGGLAGLGLQAILPRTYTATATVLVLPTRIGLDSTVAGAQGGTVEIETEAELARSAEVADAAAAELGDRMDPDTLRASSSVAIPENSTVLSIAVNAPSAELASDAANALAQAYLDRREEEATKDTSTVTDALTAQATALGTQLEENSNRIATLGTGDPAARALAESQRSLLVSQLADVNSRLTALQSGSGTGGEVITVATPPSAPASPNLLVNIGAGLLAGALAGAAVLLLADRRDQRRRRARRRSLSAPIAVLEVNPRTPVPSQHQRAEIAATNRVCAEVDSFMHPGEGGPVVLLHIGSPTLAAGFARRFADFWTRDHGGGVLVRADHEDGERRGLADILRGEATLAEASAVEQGRTYSVLDRGRGGVPTVPSGLRAGLARLWVEILAERGAAVISMGGPLSSVEAQSILRTASAILLILSDEPEESTLSESLEDLEVLGLAPRIVGAVEIHPPQAHPDTEMLAQPRGPVGRRRRKPARDGQADSPAESSQPEELESTDATPRPLPVRTPGKSKDKFKSTNTASSALAARKDANDDAEAATESPAPADALALDADGQGDASQASPPTAPAGDSGPDTAGPEKAHPEKPQSLLGRLTAQRGTK
ncbi:MAG: hypothetical protein ACK5MT_09635 [Actinomycetales bacterium]